MSAQRTERGGDIRRAIYAGPHALVGSPVTRAIVWINVAVFVLEVLASRSPMALGAVPDQVLLVFGANAPVLTLRAGHWDTLITSMFLHGSLLHIVFNMYALRQVGPLVEIPVGSARYAVMYVLTGVVASLASAAWGIAMGRLVPSVGASGAICGVMGAAIVVGFRVEGWRSANAWNIGVWLGITLLYGAYNESIDNAAHVGGFVAGVVTAMTWRRGAVETTLKRIVYVGGAASLCVAAGLMTLFRAANPRALRAPDERTQLVVDALARHDCETAEKALLEVEALPPSPAMLDGLRRAVAEECAPRK